MMPITAGASSTNTPKVFDDGVRFPRYREQMYGDDWTRATRVPVANEVGTSPRSRLRAFKDSAGHVIYRALSRSKPLARPCRRESLPLAL